LAARIAHIAATGDRPNEDAMQNLPPSVTVSPTLVGVSVLTEAGATVQVSLPRPRGLDPALPADEVAARALSLALAALRTAADALDAA
jgi:hypothetical protein